MLFCSQNTVLATQFATLTNWDLSNCSDWKKHIIFTCCWTCKIVNSTYKRNLFLFHIFDYFCKNILTCIFYINVFISWNYPFDPSFRSLCIVSTPSTSRANNFIFCSFCSKEFLQHIKLHPV